MAHARNISVVMTVIGLLLIVGSVAAGWNPVVTVTGMLLLVAGIVKIVMIAVWKSFFSIPVEAPAQSDGPPAGGGPQSGKV